MRKTFRYAITKTNGGTISLEIPKNATISFFLDTIAKQERIPNTNLYVVHHDKNELLEKIANDTIFIIKSGKQSPNAKNTKSIDQNDSKQKIEKEKTVLYSLYGDEPVGKHAQDTYQIYSPKSTIKEESKSKGQVTPQKNENSENIQKTPRSNKPISAYKPKIKSINEESPRQAKTAKAQKPQQKSKSSKKVKYLYQTNKDSEVHEIELDSDATVLTMKQEVAKLNKVKNVANVQIIFAGKELLDELNMKSLKIGDIILFAYIRQEEDVILLTAKALRFDKNAPEESESD